MENQSAVPLRELVVAVAGPQTTFDNRKSWLARAARHANVSFRSVKAVFYNEIDDPNHPAVLLLRYAAERRAQADAQARTEAVETVRRLLALRDALAASDPQMHQPQIDALDSALRRMVGDPLPGNLRGDSR